MIRLILIPLCWLLLASFALGGMEGLYKDVKREIVKDDLKERELKASLYIINERMKKMRSKVSTVTDGVFSTQLRAQNLAQKIVRLEEKVQLAQRELSRKIQLMYKLKGQLVVNILFSSRDIYELNRNMLFLNKLGHRDSELIEGLKIDLQSLQKSRGRLRQKVKQLIVLKNTLKAQKQELESGQRYKIRLISEVKKERKVKFSKMKNLRTLLNAEKGRRLSTSFFERKGKLIHPVKGRVSNPYGVIQDSSYKYLLTHKGYFYQTPKGSFVRGIHPGKVAYSGIIDGYGKTVIVDHGDHYYTVYASQESVSVSEGQEVEVGTVLGQVGFSKRHRKIGTYFEIRHFADAVDPAQWLIERTQRTL